MVRALTASALALTLIGGCQPMEGPPYDPPAEGGATDAVVEGGAPTNAVVEGRALTEGRAPTDPVLEGGAPTGGVEAVALPEGGMAFPETGRTHVYECAPGISFTVRTGPGEIALWPPASVGGRYTVLGARFSSSSAGRVRYEDGDDVVVLEDDRAAFQIAGQRFEDCLPNQQAVPWADAARRGVTFRAAGNEPAWHLEVSPMTLTMTTNLGSDRVELEYEEPVVERLRTIYRAAGGGHDLFAVIERAPCADTMSGELFEATATVRFDGETFRGCGRFL